MGYAEVPMPISQGSMFRLPRQPAGRREGGVMCEACEEHLACDEATADERDRADDAESRIRRAVKLLQRGLVGQTSHFDAITDALAILERK
jgi:hypothetical protein